ncbi:ABC transporter substrate-binding protein [Exiguobacterium aurantiacum]|uniref:ABC transporter substrate-binding protein n=1 Tax=Exiguobacterium aurantiacum TaxID=33987 RepID=UPI0008777EBC|nr:iron-siderophore ABC transporter substrate-binding protein [Exiguobacterium aurantiacum]
MKHLWLATMAALLLVIGVGCAQSETETKTATTEKRTIEHAGGTTELSSDVEKVVVLVPGWEDYLLSLGITPVGVTNGFEQIGDGVLPYLQEDLKDAQRVGDPYQGNFEAIMATEPDVIIGDVWLKESYDQLNAIAPTILIGSEEGDVDPKEWETNFLKVAEVFGKETEAENIIQQTNDRAEELSAQFETELGDEKVAFLRVRPKDRGLNIYAKTDHPLNTLMYENLKLNAANMVPADGGSSELSFEKVPEIDADHLFFQVDNNGKAHMEEIKNSNLWQSVPAVQKNQVYPDDYWVYMAWGPKGRNLIMDQLEGHLLK